MLELQNLSKTYPNGVRALDGISLSVGAGEIVAIVGSSGCGKSTLLRAISGLDRPSRGRVLLDGESVTSPHEKIGIVFQEPRLLPWLSVAGNVGFGLEDRPRRAERTRCESNDACWISRQGGRVATRIVRRAGATRGDRPCAGSPARGLAAR